MGKWDTHTRVHTHAQFKMCWWSSCKLFCIWTGCRHQSIWQLLTINRFVPSWLLNLYLSIQHPRQDKRSIPICLVNPQRMAANELMWSFLALLRRCSKWVPRISCLWSISTCSQWTVLYGTVFLCNVTPDIYWGLLLIIIFLNRYLCCEEASCLWCGDIMASFPI